MPVKITSAAMYEQKLKEFATALLDALPKGENVMINVQPSTNPMLQLGLGGTTMEVTLTTNSSGEDKYLIWLNRDNEAEFIRVIPLTAKHQRQ